MANFELIMPKMGESIAEATIIKWLKNEGDQIAADESVLEIATDKVDSEVPAPKGGILIKRLYNEGDVIAVGAPIAIIGDSAEASAGTSTPADSPAREEKQPDPVAHVNNTVNAARESTAPIQAGRFYSPLVLNIARSEGISMSELETIPGTGGEGRVTKKDILVYLDSKKSGTQQNQQTQKSQPAPETHKAEPHYETAEPDTGRIETRTDKPKVVEQPRISAPAITPMPGDEIIEMDRMRKLIADHMVMSKHVSPHVTSFVEADVTNMVNWREKVKKNYEKREGEKITFTPLFIEAVVKAIKDYPMINVSVDGSRIVKRKSINIGMATALPTGNLIVPVIKNADMMNLIGITKTVNDLAARARNNKLSPDEIQGGTFTLTNVGGFGNVMGTPIINQPQVAILAVGAIKKKPAVIETEYGDVIAIRHMMFLSLSYDHRVVDGSLGGSFLRRVADYLEQFDQNRDF